MGAAPRFPTCPIANPILASPPPQGTVFLHWGHPRCGQAWCSLLLPPPPVHPRGCFWGDVVPRTVPPIPAVCPCIIPGLRVSSSHQSLHHSRHHRVTSPVMADGWGVSMSPPQLHPSSPHPCHPPRGEGRDHAGFVLTRVTFNDKEPPKGPKFPSPPFPKYRQHPNYNIAPTTTPPPPPLPRMDGRTWDDNIPVTHRGGCHLSRGDNRVPRSVSTGLAWTLGCKQENGGGGREGKMGEVGPGKTHF